jgi:hypothetical protein
MRSHEIALARWRFSKATGEYLLVDDPPTKVFAGMKPTGNLEIDLRVMDETHAKALRVALAREAKEAKE